jgi:hypothetical protein
MTMDEISFHRLKAERRTRLAKDEPDTHRKLELETEGTLWLELADAEERLDEVRKKVRSHLNATTSTEWRLLASRPARQTPSRDLI